jgi:hypothetical protein
MASPLEVVQEWRRRQRAGETEAPGDIINLNPRINSPCPWTGWTFGSSSTS